MAKCKIGRCKYKLKEIITSGVWKISVCVCSKCGDTNRKFDSK